MTTAEPTYATPVNLTILREIITRVPINTADLICQIDNLKSMQWFHSFVKTFLPHQYDYIFQEESPSTIVERFGRTFKQRYFPINDMALDSMSDNAEYEGLGSWDILNKGIQYELFGFIVEDIHEFWEDGQHSSPTQLACLLIPAEYIAWDADEGIKISWFEHASEIIDQETLKKIPTEGFDPIDAVIALQEENMPGMANLIKWMTHGTGNFFLDNQYHSEDYQEQFDDWDQETIDFATVEWQAAEPIWQSIISTQDWIYSDPPTNFKKVVDVLNEGIYWWASTQTQ